MFCEANSWHTTPEIFGISQLLSGLGNQKDALGPHGNLWIGALVPKKIAMCLKNWNFNPHPLTSKEKSGAEAMIKNLIKHSNIMKSLMKPPQKPKMLEFKKSSYY